MLVQQSQKQRRERQISHARDYGQELPFSEHNSPWKDQHWGPPVLNNNGGIGEFYMVARRRRPTDSEEKTASGMRRN